MAIPTQQELYNPVLEFLSDGKVHTSEQLQKFVRSRFHLTAAQRAKKVDSGAPVWTNRIAWTIRQLKEDGMLVNPQRAHYQITDKGRNHLAENVSTVETVIDSPLEVDGDDDPLKKFDQFERLYHELDENFIDDLLNVILNMPLEKFKALIDRLLRTLDYDGEEIVDIALNPNKSGNINGSIMLSNKNGFDVRHIEAKRLPYDEVIDEDELQRFVKAMEERSQIKKGMFLATATFLDEAKEYADEHSVYLLDIDDVINLMLDRNLGVTTRTYELKYIDRKFFMS